MRTQGHQEEGLHGGTLLLTFTLDQPSNVSPGLGTLSNQVDALLVGNGLVTNPFYVNGFLSVTELGRVVLELVLMPETLHQVDEWIVSALGCTRANTSLDPVLLPSMTLSPVSVLVASANGSVFTYGDAPYQGGMSDVHLNGSIIARTGW